jgi:hyperosmotically inducible protein
MVAVSFAFACSQSDTAITAAVKLRMLGDDLVKAHTIDVETNNRVVTLTGAVETPEARARAVGLARNTDGVKSVVDNLVISSSAEGTAGIGERVFEGLGRTAAQVEEAAKAAGRKAAEQIDETKRLASDAANQAGAAAEQAGAVITDAALTAAVKGKLLADADVSGLKIEVSTKDGVVTLGGAVHSMAERDRAVMIARQTSSVRSVVDRMRVEP